MKRFFSYRQDRFLPSLVLSAVVHLAVAVSGHFTPEPAAFGVRQAPSSIELMLVEEAPLPERFPEQYEVITTRQETEPEQTINPQPAQEKEEQPEITSPAEQGALTEPRPVEHINPSPRYPRLARSRGWEGLVLLRVLVDLDGQVERVDIEKSSGYRVLDKEAVDVVSRWQFEPARRGVLRTAATVTVPVRFKLEH